MLGPRAVAMSTHAFFPDDLMIFCRGHKNSLQELIHLFQRYGEMSSQWINPHKCIFYHGGLPRARLQFLSSILEFKEGRIPFNYLGVPIFYGKPRKVHLMHTVDRIRAKLSSWKGKLLSIMGRIQLTKSVVHGML